MLPSTKPQSWNPYFFVSALTFGRRLDHTRAVMVTPGAVRSSATLAPSEPNSRAPSIRLAIVVHFLRTGKRARPADQVREIAVRNVCLSHDRTLRISLANRTWPRG